MGLFSRKTDDTKARIEELKKKIQVEQAAFAQKTDSTKPALTTAGSSSASVAATPAQPAPPAAPAQATQIVIEEREPAHAVSPAIVATSSASSLHHAHSSTRTGHASDSRERDSRRELGWSERPRQHDHGTHGLAEMGGIVLDLGQGMSLNVPVRARMKLDDFLHLADRVRELQQLQERPVIR
jgi:hypothetical protein